MAHAAELKKRIVPVALGEVADDEIPETIRIRNWIPAGEDDGRLAGAVDGLNEDPGHKRETSEFEVGILGGE